MLDVEDVSKEVINRLGNYLRSKMTNISIVEEFPSANIAIKMPCISIIPIGNVPFQAEMNPYVFSETAIVNHKKDVRYVIGQHSFNLQLDLWCRNKEERSDYYKKFFTVFNSQFPRLGLLLNLTDYFNVPCKYHMVSFVKEDAEISSQTREWRVKINLMADCCAIIEKQEFIMEYLELKSEIPTETEQETKTI